jgi:hypothetical protein
LKAVSAFQKTVVGIADPDNRWGKQLCGWRCRANQRKADSMRRSRHDKEVFENLVKTAVMKWPQPDLRDSTEK